MKTCCLLREVIDALEPFARLHVTQLELSTEESADGDSLVVVRLDISPAAQTSPSAALATIELHNRLKYVADMGSLRALAEEYGIDAAALEALLPKED